MRHRAHLIIVLAAVLWFDRIPAADASQIANHVRVARQAWQHPLTPPAIKGIIARNLDAYQAGAAGPDVFTNLVGQYDELAHMPHYRRTGELIRQLIAIAYEQSDVARRERYLAYALGWLTHYHLDFHEHRLVNRYGGYYKLDHTRHKALEMFETAHVMASVPDPSVLVAPASGLPDRIVYDALTRLFPTDLVGDFFKPVRELREARRAARVAGFEGDIKLAAQLLEQFTRDNIAQFQQQTVVWSITEPAMGPIPFTNEYRNLLQPLDVTITNFVIDPRVRAGDRRGIYATVDWTVHDDGLTAGYVSDWYFANQLAEEAIAESFRATNATLWRAPPPLTDNDLDAGAVEGRDEEAVRASSAFSRTSAVELSWEVLGAGRARLTSGSQVIYLDNVPISRTTTYRNIRNRQVAIDVPAVPALFVAQNQKLVLRVTLRMINNNRQLAAGRYVTAFRFSDPPRRVVQRREIVEAADEWRSAVDMPALTDADDAPDSGTPNPIPSPTDRTGLVGSSGTDAGDGYSVITNSALPGMNNQLHGKYSVAECKKLCTERPWCRSFDYDKKGSWCQLSGGSLRSAPLRPDTAWDFYYNRSRLKPQ
jgi:hypothetical protein